MEETIEEQQQILKSQTASRVAYAALMQKQLNAMPIEYPEPVDETEVAAMRADVKRMVEDKTVQLKKAFETKEYEYIGEDGAVHYRHQRYFRRLLKKRIRAKLHRQAMTAVLAKERSFNKSLEEIAKECLLNLVAADLVGAPTPKDRTD